MKMLIAVIICKILYIIGKLIGRGSSLPGKIALKICPDALKKLKLPGIIIAVTGSNGKTTTVEMIAHALETEGLQIGCNREGSNQTEGIATLLLRTATLGGEVKRDALVLECDERYTRRIFEHIRPTVLLITNLCRDQLTRNGHPEFIYDCLRAAIEAIPASKLILNADDPYVTALARTYHADGSLSTFENVSWFGVANHAVPQHATAPSGHGIADTPKQLFHYTPDIASQAPDEKAQSLYDDGAYCPVCKSRMAYSYRVTAHFGGYHCQTCGHSRPKPGYEATELENRMGILVLNDAIPTRLEHPSLTGAYNLTAAVAAAAEAGISMEKSAQALSGYKLKGGRVAAFSAGDRCGVLLVSKHENSLAYDQSLRWVVEQRSPCAVIILVDSISRKYYTSETSWLWDINFNILADECVQSIILSGRYTSELAARFAMTPVNQQKIRHVPQISALCENAANSTTGIIYAITCFADKQKLLKAFRAGRRNVSAIGGSAAAHSAAGCEDGSSVPHSAEQAVRDDAPSITDSKTPDVPPIQPDNAKPQTPSSGPREKKRIRILHLYPGLMNLYGDWANAGALAHKLETLGCEAVIERRCIGDAIGFDAYDYVCIGSGTERNQIAMLRDISRHKDALIKRIEDGMHVLATGNAHEIFGQSITDADGSRHEALKLLAFETSHENTRITGDCVCSADFLPDKLIGFINRVGGSQKGETARPFRHVAGPYAKNAQCAEGIIHKNLLGTYMTGPVLVRNPPLLDYIAGKLTNDAKPAQESPDAFLSHQSKAYKSALINLMQPNKP